MDLGGELAAATLRRCQRVLVLGSPGAGKTTLAKELFVHLGLPLYQLDDEYWLPGWTRPTPRAWARRLDELCREPRGIIDGNYFDSLPIRARWADCAIVMRAQWWRCLFRVTRRGCVRALGDQKSLPLSVRDGHAGHSRIDPRFAWKVLRFGSTILPATLQLLEQENVTVIPLRSSGEKHLITSLCRTAR